MYCFQQECFILNNRWQQLYQLPMKLAVDTSEAATIADYLEIKSKEKLR